MFEFVTISNGMAVVQHAPTGWIYRFRPTHPGVWSSLTLQTVDGDGSADGEPGDHESAARHFAEETAAACCEVAVAATVPAPPSRLRSLLSVSALHRLGQG